MLACSKQWMVRTHRGVPEWNQVQTGWHHTIGVYSRHDKSQTRLTGAAR